MNVKKYLAKALENWPAKILSLGLAVLIFIFYRMSTLEERFFSAPLEVEYLGNLVPSNSYPHTVRVKVRGEAENLHTILESDIEVYADMKQYTEPGTYHIPVLWRKSGTAQGIDPLQITVEPLELTLSLDYRISKYVPLKPRFSGQVPPGYTMASYSLNPAQVIIDGPAALIAGISEVYTEDIELDDKYSNLSLSVNILNNEPLIAVRGNGVSDFTGVINRIVPVRDIANVPVAVTGLSEDFLAELEIKAASIHLEGENQDAVNSFVPPPDFLKVDCSGINEPGTYILRIIAAPVENIRAIAEPQEVTIQISSPAGGLDIDNRNWR